MLLAVGIQAQAYGSGERMGEGGHGMGMGMGGGEGGAGVSCSGFDVQINGGCCQGAMEMVVHSDCIQGAPHYDQEGDVCDNDGTATEAYCSYDVESNSEGGACAYCTVPLDFSGGGGGKGGGKGMGGSKGMGGEGGKVRCSACHPGTRSLLQLLHSPPFLPLPLPFLLHCYTPTTSVSHHRHPPTNLVPLRLHPPITSKRVHPTALMLSHNTCYTFC